MLTTMNPSTNPAQEYWDNQYAEFDGYAYGTTPNDFLRQVWPSLGVVTGSKCLLLAEGEGRNAVYLAQLGMVVTAVDISAVGLAKAQKLAFDKNVVVETIVADLATYNMGVEQWHVIVSIFNHVPPTIRQRLLQRIPMALKPGGYFVLEGYTPTQLNHHDNSPKCALPDPATPLMYSQEILHDAFAGAAEVYPPNGGESNNNNNNDDDATTETTLDIIRNQELIRTIQEGEYHAGQAAVVQFIGQKRRTRRSKQQTVTTMTARVGSSINSKVSNRTSSDEWTTVIKRPRGRCRSHFARDRSVYS